MPETIELNNEPTQDYFLAFMRDTLRFSEDQIEANRRHNGRLFLTPAVVLGAIRDGDALNGSSVNVLTGELTLSLHPLMVGRKKRSFHVPSSPPWRRR